MDGKRFWFVMFVLGTLSASGCSRATQAVSGQEFSSVSVLSRAARVGEFGRAYIGGSVAEGRIVALSPGYFRIADYRLAASELDSLFIRRDRGPNWRGVAAGAGIGTLVALFAGEIWSGLGDTPASRGKWAVGGGIAGALLGMAFSGSAVDEHWEKRWPTAN